MLSIKFFLAIIAIIAVGVLAQTASSTYAKPNSIEVWSGTSSTPKCDGTAVGKSTSFADVTAAGVASCSVQTIGAAGATQSKSFKAYCLSSSATAGGYTVKTVYGNWYGYASADCSGSSLWSGAATESTTNGVTTGSLKCSYSSWTGDNYYYVTIGCPSSSAFTTVVSTVTLVALAVASSFANLL
jgi:hypothetical protein